MRVAWEDPTVLCVVCKNCQAAVVLESHNRPGDADVEEWCRAHRCHVEADDEAPLAWAASFIAPRRVTS
jgi:hypothetical protein